MHDEEAPGDEEPAFKALREARYSHSLQRGLAILSQFTPEHPVQGIAELAGSLGMSRATTHRYVTTLVAEGYLERDTSRKYRLATGAVDLGMATLNAVGICRHASTQMGELARRSGFTVDLTVLDGLELLLIDSARPSGHQGKSAANDEVGTHLPVYCTSAGKLLLAHIAEQRRARILAEITLSRVGPRTIMSKSQLAAQLETVQVQDIASENEERLAATCSIAAPVRDESGAVIAALSLSAHHGEIDLEGLIVWFSSQLIGAATRVSRNLGWQEDRDSQS